MADIQSFDEIYKELATLVHDKMPQINWQDLWSDQVGFLESEHPFPAPAIFWEFRSSAMEDLSHGAQVVTMQIDAYLFYETFIDTAHGFYNDNEAVAYLKDLTLLHQVLHRYKGEHIDSMRRVGFARIESGGFGNLYRVSYEATTRDNSAASEQQEMQVDDINLQDFQVQL